MNFNLFLSNFATATLYQRGICDSRTYVVRGIFADINCPNPRELRSLEDANRKKSVRKCQQQRGAKQVKRNHRKLCCFHRCHDQLRRRNENETQHQNHNLKLIIASLCGFMLVRVKRFWLFYTSPTIVTHYTNRLVVATTAGRQLCRSKSNPGNTPAALLHNRGLEALDVGEVRTRSNQNQ